MTTTIEQEAREAALKRFPVDPDENVPLSVGYRAAYQRGYIAGATREPTEAEVEAAARVLWAADDAETETSWPSNREFYLTTARAALDAARQVGTQPTEPECWCSDSAQEYGLTDPGCPRHQPAGGES